MSRSAVGAGAKYGGRAVKSCRIRSHQQSEDKEPGDQEKGRNGRWSCRLSADGYATVHPRCAEGPGPGVVPGTRAFGGGGVDVICSTRGLRGALAPRSVSSGWPRDCRALAVALCNNSVFSQLGAYLLNEHSFFAMAASLRCSDYLPGFLRPARIHCAAAMWAGDAG